VRGSDRYSFTTRSANDLVRVRNSSGVIQPFNYKLQIINYKFLPVYIPQHNIN
jgi:hypothetical protein